jgi:hypothetical protein
MTVQKAYPIQHLFFFELLPQFVKFSVARTIIVILKYYYSTNFTSYLYM